MSFLSKLFKAVSITALLFLTLALKPISDDCSPYFLLEEPTELVYKNYTGEGISKSLTSTKVVSKTIAGDQVVFNVKSTSKSLQGHGQGELDFNVQCEGGVFKMGMAAFINPQLLNLYSDYEIRVDQPNIEFGNELKEGQELINGKVKVKLLKKGIRVATLLLMVKNHVVEGAEKIVTDAGTFGCVKITYDAVTSTGFISEKSKETYWLAKNVGIVKKESHNKKKELLGRSELISINQ